MGDELPLPALASAALVAFTIEADNEVERMLPHRTTSFGATGERGAAWLTSLAMWFNCLRGLGEMGESTVAELERHARMPTNLDGMRRWGLITIDGVGRVPRGAERPRARPGSVLALTGRGRTADEIWRAVPSVIERRWRERFGAGAVDRLRSALVALVCRFDAPLPDFMPIGGVRRVLRADAQPREPHERDADRDLPLVSLCARVLMQCELDYEPGAMVSLAAWANALRVLETDTAVAMRDLPGRTGVSKEALAMLTGRLERAGYVVLEPAPGRGRQARLAADRGARAKLDGRTRIDATMEDWSRRYGEDTAATVVSALVPIVGDATREGSPLFAGLQPPPGGWRARVRAPQTLPWYPMVLHRGGYPDGS